MSGGYGAMHKRIDEISMLKGAGILLVICEHMANISGVPICAAFASILAPVMMMFFFVSGYTVAVKSTGAFAHLRRNTGRLLIPYYLYSAVMIAILAVIYLLIEHRSFAWFADGTLGILFQLQSFHLFDPASAGVHPMFYPVLVGWFLFQMAVSNCIFIPLLYALDRKKRILKPIAALILLAAGAALYILNLQQLNGEFFPPVCKVFILPNIPGIAGIMMLGNCASEYSLLDPDPYTVPQKITVLVCIPVLAAFVMTDDLIYDFPIGKWGAFGAASYLLTPVYMLALIYAALVTCYLIKKIKPARNVLVFFGDNSMDHLIIHFFAAFLVAYTGGFWHNFLSEPVPADDMRRNTLRFFILTASVLAICCALVWIKQWFKKKKAASDHQSESQSLPPESQELSS